MIRTVYQFKGLYWHEKTYVYIAKAEVYTIQYNQNKICTGENSFHASR